MAFGDYNCFFNPCLKVAVDSATLQAMQGLENASVSQDAMGNTTIIYEQGQASCHSRGFFEFFWAM